MVQGESLAGLIALSSARIVLSRLRPIDSKTSRAFVGATDSEERKVMRVMHPQMSPVTTGGWIANYVGTGRPDDGVAWVRGVAQQNSVGEFAFAHDVNASDFGWANLERSCYGTDR